MKMNFDDYILYNRKAYDLLSDAYKIRGEVKSGYEETPQYLVDNVLEFALKDRCLSVLEIGPGSGEIIEYFENKGHRTIAVELSEQISIIAKNKSHKSIIINSNILDIDFLENQFDVIYAGALIHLFPKVDAYKLINLISKWLKPTGVLFINTTISNKSEEGYYSKIDYDENVVRFRRKWSEQDFEEFIFQKFNILKKLYTNEADRKKTWVGFICQNI